MEKIKDNKKSVYEYKRVENEESLKIRYFHIKKREILVGNYNKDVRLIILNNFSKKLSHVKKVAFMNKETHKKILKKFSDSNFNQICVSSGEVCYYEKNANGEWIEQ